MFNRLDGNNWIAGLALAAACVVAADARANNVQATQEGSLIKVRGDNANNQVTISQNAASDVIVAGASGTLVNGQASVVFPQLALNALDVQMEGGNDRVTLSNLRIANDLYVNLGACADPLQTSARPSEVGANATVEGGSGNDVVNLTGMTVGEDLFIDGQTGGLNSNLVRLEVGKGLTIIGDLTNDVVAVSMTTVGLGTSIETKAGNDRATVRDHSGFGLSMFTDEGNDTVDVARVVISEDIEVTTGTQNDAVTFSDVTSGKNIKVSLDTDVDSFIGTNVQAQLEAVFEGGNGVDTFGDFGITGGTKKEIKEFEIFLP